MSFKIRFVLVESDTTSVAKNNNTGSSSTPWPSDCLLGLFFNLPFLNLYVGNHRLDDRETLQPLPIRRHETTASTASHTKSYQQNLLLYYYQKVLRRIGEEKTSSPISG